MLSYLVIIGGLVCVYSYWSKKRIQVIGAIVNHLAKIVTSKSAVSFSINDSERSASIVYSRFGNNYIINVPYARELVPRMVQIKAMLIKSDKQIDVTQQPGIPYLITAAMLGGDKIILSRGDDHLEFGPNEIPDITKLVKLRSN